MLAQPINSKAPVTYESSWYNVLAWFGHNEATMEIDPILVTKGLFNETYSKLLVPNSKAALWVIDGSHLRKIKFWRKHLKPKQELWVLNPKAPWIIWFVARWLIGKADNEWMLLPSLQTPTEVVPYDDQSIAFKLMTYSSIMPKGLILFKAKLHIWLRPPSLLIYYGSKG